MGCDCGKPKCDGHCGVSPAVLQINNPSECVLFHRVEVPASMGDSKTNPPKSGAYKNVLLYYEADQTSWLYSSDGVPQKLVNGVTNYEDAINLPQINGVTLLGNKNSADLELADAPMVITVANGNTSWSGADTAEDIYNFFLDQGKVNVVFGDSENYGYEIVSAAYIPEEQKMMCTLAVAAITAGETTEFDGNALFGIMTLYTADKAIDVSQIELQPKLYVTDFTGLDLNYNELSGLPATTYSIGMVKPGDGLEVASDGTLMVIDHVFDTVADMKLATNLVDGSYARTLGFHAVNDGGGALYKITDTGTANEMDVIAIDSLYANLIYDDELNVKKFGAYGNDSNDDTSSIVRCLSLSKNCYLPSGNYIISQTLEFGNKIIRGDGRFKTFIKPSDSLDVTSLVSLTGDHNIIKSLCIASNNYDYDVAGTTNTNTAIDLGRTHHNIIEDVRILGFNIGIYAYRAWLNTFRNCMFICCNTGLHGQEEFNGILVDKCLFNTCIKGGYFAQGHSIELEGCSFEKNTTGFEVRNNSDLLCSGGYFENNTESSIHVQWGTTYVDNVRITGCSFWTNDSCECILKFHASPNSYIVMEQCDFRNNSAVTTPIPILTRTNSSQCKPHLIGCTIGDSYSVEDRYFVNRLQPKLIASSDWFEPASGVTIQSSNLFEDNKHVYGTVVFKFTTAPTAAQQSIGTFKSRYTPSSGTNSYAALSAQEYQQSTNDLCYFYYGSSGITIGNGNGTATYVKAYIDYVTN